MRSFYHTVYLDYDLVKDKEKLKRQKIRHSNHRSNQKRTYSVSLVLEKQFLNVKDKKQYEKRIEDRQQELDQINTGDVVKGTVDKIEPHAATIRLIMLLDC
jgi:small subunit ribosomal protein S1